MHRRQLVVLYSILSIVSALLVWRFASEWKRATLRYGNLPRVKAGAPAAIPPATVQRPAPLVADIVAKNLFSPDRNNEIVQEQKAAAPPPVPIVFGTLNLGGSYEALMAEGGKPGRPVFRRVKNGERMGEYQVVAISDEKVVVELQGQKTTINVYQSANSVPRIEARSAPVAAPVVESNPLPRPAEPASSSAATSAATASSGAATQPGSDASVRVTVEGNRRRMERQTPFGPQVWYENIQK